MCAGHRDKLCLDRHNLKSICCPDTLRRSLSNDRRQGAHRTYNPKQEVMTRHFQLELDKLKVKTMNMFALVERAFHKSLRGLFDRDDDLAEEVIQEDKQINRLEVEIDDFCLRILALEQPVAKDLRFIIGSFHITEALERIGDQSTNIAEKAMFINLKPELPIMNMVKTMSDIVGEMLGEVITAYNNMDDALSLRIREMDSRVDDLNQKIVKTIIDEMGCEASTIGRGVNIIAVSSYLERVADLATNIAEDVVFISRGRNIKHSSHFDYQE